MCQYTSTHMCTAFIYLHTYRQTHTHIDTSTSTQTHTHAQIQTTLSSQNTQRNNLLFLSYHSLYTQIHANSPKSEFCKTFFFYAFLLLIFLYTQWVGIFSLSLGYVISVRQQTAECMLDYFWSSSFILSRVLPFSVLCYTNLCNCGITVQTFFHFMRLS